MADKEIIIDGVDVAGCEAYIPKLGKNDCIALANNSASTCKGSPNCYYKQLQRERKDHKEEWRLYNEAFKKSREEWEKQRSELIEKHNKLCRDFFSGMYCNTKYCEVLQAKERECDRYQQALKKIEEFVEPIYEQIPESRILRQILLMISEKDKKEKRQGLN